MGKHVFSAEIFIVGVNPYILIPNHILTELFWQAKKEKGAIPVKGKINGKDFIQTLVKYQGVWRLYINGIMRKAAKVEVGNNVIIEIAFNATPPKVPMNTTLSKAFTKEKK